LALGAISEATGGFTLALYSLSGVIITLMLLTLSLKR
jgi:hypothetical protein